MNEIEKIKLQDIDHNSEYNFFDIIFFAWQRKIRYFIISLSIAAFTLLFLYSNNPRLNQLTIVIESPKPDDSPFFNDFELKCRDYLLGKGCGQITEDTFQKKIVDIIYYDNKKYDIFKNILSNRISDKDLEYISIEVKTDINTLSQELAGSVKYSPLLTFDLQPIKGLNSIALVHKDIKILNLIAPYLVNEIEKLAIEEFYDLYNVSIKILKSDINYKTKSLKRVISIIEKNKVARVVSEKKSALVIEEEFNPFVLSLQKELELSEWENVDVSSFEMLLQSKHLLSKLDQNNSYHLIQSSDIAQISLPKKKYILISIIVSSIFIFLNIIVDIEFKKRKIK
jgi:hypothetical protein